MTEEQAIEILQEHKKQIDKEYISARNSKAIEIVLSMLKEKDKQIDLMANHIATSDSDLCEYLDITVKCKYYAGDNGKTCDNCIKQYFENKAKEEVIQMKLEHVYNTVQKAMTELESVDLVDISKRKQSQIKVNKVYDILDNFKDELIREKIKNGRHK